MNELQIKMMIEMSKLLITRGQILLKQMQMSQVVFRQPLSVFQKPMPGDFFSMMEYFYQMIQEIETYCVFIAIPTALPVASQAPEGRVAPQASQASQAPPVIEGRVATQTASHGISIAPKFSKFKVKEIPEFVPQRTKTGLPVVKKKILQIREPELDPDCIICMVNPKQVLLQPCKHRVCCNDCFEDWIENCKEKGMDLHCPICRQELII